MENTMAATFPFRVRAEEAKTATIKFLKQKCIQAPPVPVKKMLRELGSLFYFYISQCPDFAKEEAFSIYKDGAYFIYINADLPCGRDNFTYAHEIAHIILLHHQLDVDELTEHEHWVLDREADIFAATLLMPEDWIEDWLKQHNEGKGFISIPEIGQLKDLFAVSWGAMIYRLDELELQSKTVAYKTFTARNPTGHAREMFKFENRIRECPRCGNTDISSDDQYCKYCGLHLFNECSNVNCGKRNDADALYCVHCGSETSFFRAGILSERKIGKEDDHVETELEETRRHAHLAGGYDMLLR